MLLLLLLLLLLQQSEKRRVDDNNKRASKQTSKPFCIIAFDEFLVLLSHAFGMQSEREGECSGSNCRRGTCAIVYTCLCKLKSISETCNYRLLKTQGTRDALEGVACLVKVMMKKRACSAFNRLTALINILLCSLCSLSTLRPTCTLHESRKHFLCLFNAFSKSKLRPANVEFLLSLAALRIIAGCVGNRC